MQTQKYTVNQYMIASLLTWVRDGEIAIPEIQRPFVWSSTKVRDLLDSLYQGFPVGYVITWKNPDVRLKDGSRSEGKKILIDGQQRVTALKAAIQGDPVVNENYRKVTIRIAFHPIQEKFEVLNPAIQKDKQWLPDISEVFNHEKGILSLVKEYKVHNPDVNEDVIERTFTNLLQIPQKQVGMIELDSGLDIETVTEIFIRINSEGVVLSQADFAMSKIASNEQYDGHNLRKAIDYFCHLAVAPEFYEHIKENDKNFTSTPYWSAMSWLGKGNGELYDPSYSDMLRVAFLISFRRGKLSDLVSLLSGRNFETRSFEENIAEASFDSLRDGILSFMSQTHYDRFLMILGSAGFVNPEMLRSRNAVNGAYALYHMLEGQKTPSSQIERLTRRWLVYSLLTSHYSGSAESTFDYDMRQMKEKGIQQYIEERISAELSEGFWNTTLVDQLQGSTLSNTAFNLFMAAQVKMNDKGFLSRDITVADMLKHRGDYHHLFPKAYLKKQGYHWGIYNQVANFVMTQQEINIRLGSMSPSQYFELILDQFNGGTKVLTGIDNREELMENLRSNCVPESIFTGTFENYQDFLAERRKLMAEKVREYFYSL